MVWLSKKLTSPNLRPEVLIAMGTVAEDVPMLTGIMGQFGNYKKCNRVQLSNVFKGYPTEKFKEQFVQTNSDHRRNGDTILAKPKTNFIRHSIQL